MPIIRGCYGERDAEHTDVFVSVKHAVCVFFGACPVYFEDIAAFFEANDNLMLRMKTVYLMYLKKFLPPWTLPEIQTDLSTTGERSYIPPRCLRVSSPDSPKRDAINRLLQTTGIYLQGSTMACSDAYRLRSLLAARCEHTMRQVCKCAAQLSEEATESWDTCVGLRKLLLC